MFYDRYMQLCQRNNEKPYKLAVKLGAKSNSVVAQWKKGSAPRAELLNNIAEHFGVTIGYLLTGEQPAYGMVEPQDEEIIELREMWESSNQEDRDFLIATARMLKARRKTMNRNFNDFIEFATSRTKEITADIVSTMQHAYNDKLTISQHDIALITEIAIQSSFAILRQYQLWQSQED